MNITPEGAGYIAQFLLFGLLILAVENRTWAPTRGMNSVQYAFSSLGLAAGGIALVACFFLVNGNEDSGEVWGGFIGVMTAFFGVVAYFSLLLTMAANSEKPFTKKKR